MAERMVDGRRRGWQRGWEIVEGGGGRGDGSS